MIGCLVLVRDECALSSDEWYKTFSGGGLCLLMVGICGTSILRGRGKQDIRRVGEVPPVVLAE